MEPFSQRFGRVRSTHGPLVWGLDPSRDLLSSWGLGDTPDGLDLFVDIVMEAASGAVGLIKPQAAFYERHGWRGIRSLTRLVSEAREAGILVILDAKRGDVTSTNDAYAESYLGADAAIPVDALTVHPYLGFGAMASFIDRAHWSGSCVLVVTRSSNPEGRSLQSAIGESRQSVEASILDDIGSRNEEMTPGEIGPIGAVIGPTHIEPALDLVGANALFLAPGVGAQGATPAEVATVFRSCPERVMPSASRLLLDAGPAVPRLRAGVESLAAVFVELLGP